jgi:hypothetical protein
MNRMVKAGFWMLADGYKGYHVIGLGPSFLPVGKLVRFDLVIPAIRYLTQTALLPALQVGFPEAAFAFLGWFTIGSV